ncbi:hypothetical protein SAMN05192534_10532 [Alteribacillus persepolensis]|uniref:DUF454 domain-containing protein n=1 Tax=Alteribacillus persepolensis TaxID=568899 RepID=A0A1G8C1Y1_9BACI|nr:YbaN family protein [Alteribacillus persepolensis]SDH39384.1 hypothetical protein SAMN05192534_10532 [Alteribacillus persepolensis]
MHAIKKAVLVFIGSLSVALGVLGIILPLLPTTPFLLLAAFCYAKSSHILYDKLLATRLGGYIKQYKAGHGLPLKTKVVALALLWGSSAYSILFLVPFLAVQIGLAMIVLYITYWILRLKTYRPAPNKAPYTKSGAIQKE